jgi:2-polyprenyl-3-methyl-5-hydroxy-6-metoxy-1,4-benzoquinol methylase
LRDFPSKARPRVLDVGCGDGRLLEQDLRAGWEGVGIDFSQRAVARGKERGLDVRLGALDEVSLPSESFDLVRLSHVIEHVPDPRDLLRRSYELLRPGGRVHVVTPNFASPLARLAGRYWYDLDPPRHLVLFTPRVLRDAAEGVGFIVEKEAHEAMSSGSWRSLAFRLRERWPESPLLVAGSLRFSDVAPRLLYPLTWALALLKRGERMHVVLRKPGE